ncbi:MAG: dethiobiotin synthase [Candidatus Onthomorpha sp.]
MKDNIYFVSGIGTDIGKTYATAFLANKWRKEGMNVITQKFIQTGCKGISDDIMVHRRLMNMPLCTEDTNQTTCGAMFSYPASIHLAASIDGREVDLKAIEEKTNCLSEKFDRVLVEGAGGLMVPIRQDLLTIDYVAAMNYKVVFVTNPFLGSINHSLLSFEAMKARNMRLDTLIFNNFTKAERSELIERDSEKIIRLYAEKMFGDICVLSCGEIRG